MASLQFVLMENTLDVVDVALHVFHLLKEPLLNGGLQRSLCNLQHISDILKAEAPCREAADRPWTAK